MGCKWSSLNDPETENPLSHSLLGLHDSLFPLLAIWGNKNWLSSMKVNKLENFLNKRGLKEFKWFSYNVV